MTTEQRCLRGRVQFPIGGKVRERKAHDPVRFRDQQYSLDERRYGQFLHCTEVLLFYDVTDV